jgi:hypothetical protein
MSEMEVSEVRETFFSLEDGKPTLWDPDYDGRKPPAHATRAVCLTASDGRVEIHTDAETVEAFLD